VARLGRVSELETPAVLRGVRSDTVIKLHCELQIASHKIDALVVPTWRFHRTGETP